MVSLALEGLGLGYKSPEGPVSAFSGFDAEIPASSIAAIVGPSGCGKTSLVRVIAGLLEPTEGKVVIRRADGGEAADAAKAVIFQDYGLLPWKTVSANVELPLKIGGMRATQRRARTEPIIEELGLSDFARFYPLRLSGGMRQRVALARALVQEPELLIMDEPFSSLDALTREAMQDSFLELQRRRGTTVLLVTHSIEEAARLAEVVYVMRNRNPGTLAATVKAPEGLRLAREGEVSAFRSSGAFLEYAKDIRLALEGPKEGA
jgi:ABC-type nitrate/sulfonate/bicarbonate transport system ATPase subunit